MAVAGRPTLTLTRRHVLAGLAGAGALGGAGCARLFEASEGGDIDAPPLDADSKLRVIIFELDGLDLPFHAGLIIHTPTQTVIFDPLGHWEPQECRRENDLIRNPSPADEARYLSRDGVGPEGASWTLHQLEFAVSEPVAQHALTLAQETPPLPPLHCAFAVSRLLSQLPGFSFIEPDVVTADLLRSLRSHEGVRYSRRQLR